MKYLGKRKLYNLLKVIEPTYNMPACQYCSYKFYNGYEKLWFWVYDEVTDTSKEVRLTVFRCGVYVRLNEFEEDGKEIKNIFLSNLNLQLRGIKLDLTS